MENEPQGGGSLYDYGEQAEEVFPRQKTEHDQDDQAAAADRRAASEASETAAGSAAIFDVRADSTGRPSYEGVAEHDACQTRDLPRRRARLMLS